MVCQTRACESRLSETRDRCGTISKPRRRQQAEGRMGKGNCAEPDRRWRALLAVLCFLFLLPGAKLTRLEVQGVGCSRSGSTLGTVSTVWVSLRGRSRSSGSAGLPWKWMWERAVPPIRAFFVSHKMSDQGPQVPSSRARQQCPLFCFCPDPAAQSVMGCGSQHAKVSLINQC